MRRWNLKAKTLTHIKALFLHTSFPSGYTHSSTSLQTTVCSSDSPILSNQINIPTHFSSLNSTILCKQMEMYGQGRYTITLKNKNKKEMYNLTSTVPQLSLSLSLSLSHTHTHTHTHILSAILGFSKLKIIFILPMDYTLEGLFTKITNASLAVLQ